jgi:hypothetical protein
MAALSRQHCDTCGVRLVSGPRVQTYETGRLHPAGDLLVCDLCQDVLVQLALREVPNFRSECLKVRELAASKYAVLHYAGWLDLLKEAGLWYKLAPAVSYQGLSIRELIKRIVKPPDIAGPLLAADDRGIWGSLITVQGKIAGDCVLLAPQQSISEVLRRLAVLAEIHLRESERRPTN